MPDFGPHAAFIVASYAIVSLVLAASIGWLITDGRVKARELARLDARRSSATQKR